MKPQPNLKEAFITCLGFSIIGFFNLGLNREDRTVFVENITWELQSQLTLSESQALKIMEINYEFYDAVSDAQQDTDDNFLPEQINQLIIEKNRMIMNVLNEDQQREWLQSHLHRPNTK